MDEEKHSILVIEDDDFMASLLRFMLERQHLSVTHVVDGRQALMLLEQAPTCHAVVLDLMLPQVSGMDVLAAMKQHPTWSTVPVLVLSAVDAGAEIVRAFRSGVNDYVTKPFNPEEFLVRLLRLLPKQNHTAP